MGPVSGTSEGRDAYVGYLAAASYLANPSKAPVVLGRLRASATTRGVSRMRALARELALAILAAGDVDALEDAIDEGVFSKTYTDLRGLMKAGAHLDARPVGASPRTHERRLTVFGSHSFKLLEADNAVSLILFHLAQQHGRSTSSRTPSPTALDIEDPNMPAELKRVLFLMHRSGVANAAIGYALSLDAPLPDWKAGAIADAHLLGARAALRIVDALFGPLSIPEHLRMDGPSWPEMEESWQAGRDWAEQLEAEAHGRAGC